MNYPIWQDEWEDDTYFTCPYDHQCDGCEYSCDIYPEGDAE